VRQVVFEQDVKKSFKTEFNFGQEVILKTEPNTVRIVSGFLLRPGSLVIGLVNGENETWHQMNEVVMMKGNFKVKGFKG
jgi:hypothetical protein